ncbi:MAG: hypothetical protein JRN67_00485, partial [Nitrososphaerota archaeon]|nr:hypothetical protein [Nitrososphaerota archaeon]
HSPLVCLTDNRFQGILGSLANSKIGRVLTIAQGILESQSGLCTFYFSENQKRSPTKFQITKIAV